MPYAGDSTGVERRPEPPQKIAQLLHSSPPLPKEPAPRSIDSYEGAAVERAGRRASGISPWLFVMATLLNMMAASVLAVIITLGVVNQDRMTAEAATGRESPSVTATLPAIMLRPIGTPDRPLQLVPQRPAQFPLQIQPGGGADEPFILALSGAPRGTILFGVNRISSDTWFLPPGSAGRLEIVLPEWSTQVFEIAVVLRRIDGAVAAQTTAFIAVPPPAVVAPATQPADETTARELAVKADRLIANGDIIGARALYQRAAELGSGPAALALGTTYDPNRLWSLGVLGLAGNRDRARQWYLRANELGNAEAKARLTALGF